MSALMPGSDERVISATYDYADADGKLLYQVVRYAPKSFLQRRPDGNDGWIWDLEGVKRVLYRLPELLAAPEHEVWIVEGEKDADRLASLGFIATTNAGGAGKWRSEFSDLLRGRHVVVLPDNDETGRRHGEDSGALPRRRGRFRPGSCASRSAREGGRFRLAGRGRKNSRRKNWSIWRAAPGSGLRLPHTQSWKPDGAA